MPGLKSLFRREAEPRIKNKLIVIPHTHWDREWYLPFQEFRFRLVQAIDDLLDLLTEQPEYRHFTLDGQAILLEDYLEVRPERRPLLEALVQQGRLSIGPWYVLPDQFLVSPEALVRNLLLGHQLAEQFGSSMPVGYLPDPFGHVSQLPQLLRGFGIDAAVLWRGVGEDGGSEFAWQGPDGSEMLVVYLANGYNNASVLPDPDDGLLNRVRQLTADLRDKAATEYLALMNGDDHATPQANIPELIAHVNPLLRDAELVHGSLAELVEGIRSSTQRDSRSLPVLRGELRSSRFSPVLPGVMSTRMWLKQRNASCEARLERWSEPFAVLADLAQGETANPGARQRGFLRVAWRHLLQNHPHDSVTGCSVDQVHDEMRTRFDWADQVSSSVTRDALQRLASRIQTNRPERNGASDDGEAIVVFNPEAHARTDFARARVSLPHGSLPALRDETGRLMPSQVLERCETPLLTETISRSQFRALGRVLGATGVSKWSQGKIDTLFRMARLLSRGRLPKLGVVGFRVEPTGDPRTVALHVSSTGDGRHDYEVVKRGLHELQRLAERDDVDYIRATIARWDEVEIGFVAAEMPALGHRVLFPEPAGQTSAAAGAASQAAGQLENEFFVVEADPAWGTLTVTDKETGRRLEGLNRFVDGGEAGDEYNYAAPPADRLVDAPCRPARISVVEDGPARATLLVEQYYALPGGLADDRRGRSARVEECAITSRVRLYPGVRRIEIETEVDNRVADHRLRVHFPTGVFASSSQAESSFWVESRPAAVSEGSADWAEQPVGTFPQARFVDVNDGRYGLLLGVKGLPEYELLDRQDGAVLALTLLRCVGWLSRDDLPTRPGHAGPMLPTPEAQCPGKHRFEYCLVPHSGDWTGVYREAHQFTLPLAALTEEAHGGLLPSSGSFLSLDGEGVVLSALKPCEEGDGFVLRCYNILPRRTRAQVSCGFKLARLERLDLGEHTLQTVPLADSTSVSLSLQPGEIATLRIVPSRP